MITDHPAISAAEAHLGRGVSIGSRSRIVAGEVILGDQVEIGDGVRIVCDRLEIGPGCRIASDVQLLSPDIRIGPACSIGGGLRAELNERFQLGRRSDVGHGVRITGQSVVAGDHLWMTDAVVIGGGGARGPRSRLTIGDRSAVMDRCFINLSEPVSIGDDSALSNGVTILTHSLWQAVVHGGTAVFAPVTVGCRNILYVNAIVGPGVRTGDDVTIAAGALVLQDVPDGAMAVGNPARIMRSTPPMPRVLDPARLDAIVREVLRTYAETLSTKGLEGAPGDDGHSVRVVYGGVDVVIRYLPLAGGTPETADITLSFDSAPDCAGPCHFDLRGCTMIGASSPIAEDLRDHLRRHTIRIFTDQPFRALPPANVARLRDRLAT